MRLLRPLLALVVTTSCAIPGSLAVPPSPSQDLPAAPGQYSQQPMDPAAAPVRRERSEPDPKRREGSKKWPWIVAGIVVVGVVVVLIASSGGGGVGY